MSGAKFKSEKSTGKKISLCLFADATLLLKSKNMQLWVMVSSILELPRKVREAKNNIIIYRFFIGQLNDFNYWLKRVGDTFCNYFSGENKLWVIMVIMHASIVLFRLRYPNPPENEAGFGWPDSNPNPHPNTHS